MKQLIIILILAGGAFMGWKVYERWDAARKHEEEGDGKPVAQAVVANSGALPGMSPNLENALQVAQRRGTPGLRDFLARYGKTIADPRLGAIELDYASLLMKDNPAEARRVFNRVKQRTATSSPNYTRVKQLERAYE
jgi:hypothetical protein